MSTQPKFRVGEVAILQPPHPSARHLWGQETTIYAVSHSSSHGEDAMGFSSNEWIYKTDVPAPPPTNLPEDQHDNWVWCEYDLRKKYDPGTDFEELMADISRTLETIK
jgi:hypothetical protein